MSSGVACCTCVIHLRSCVVGLRDWFILLIDSFDLLCDLLFKFCAGGGQKTLFFAGLYPKRKMLKYFRLEGVKYFFMALYTYVVACC